MVSYTGLTLLSPTGGTLMIMQGWVPMLLVNVLIVTNGDTLSMSEGSVGVKTDFITAS